MAVTVLVLVAAVVFLGHRLREVFHSVDALASCSEANEAQVLSPDRRYIATVFVRNCGATTSYVTHVNLRKITDVFIADRRGVIDTGEVVATDGVALVTPRWLKGTELEVRLRGTGPLKINTVGIWNNVMIRSVDEGKPPDSLK